MAASADEPSSDKPRFDPADLLGQLKEIVNGRKAPEGGGKSWLSTLIIIAVVLIGVAAWSWFSWRRNRELAKLRHEKNKAKILAEKAATDKLVADGAEAIAAGDRDLEAAQNRLDAIEADIRAEEGRYEADLRAIDSIRSWNDIAPRQR